MFYTRRPTSRVYKNDMAIFNLILYDINSIYIKILIEAGKKVGTSYCAKWECMQSTLLD